MVTPLLSAVDAVAGDGAAPINAAPMNAAPINAAPMTLLRGTASDEELAAVLVVLLHARRGAAAATGAPVREPDVTWVRSFHTVASWSPGARLWGAP